MFDGERNAFADLKRIIVAAIRRLFMFLFVCAFVIPHE